MTLKTKSMPLNYRIVVLSLQSKRRIHLPVFFSDENFVKASRRKKTVTSSCRLLWGGNVTFVLEGLSLCHSTVTNCGNTDGELDNKQMPSSESNIYTLNQKWSSNTSTPIWPQCSVGSDLDESSTLTLTLKCFNQYFAATTDPIIITIQLPSLYGEF